MEEKEIKQELKVLRKMLFDIYDEAFEQQLSDTDFYFELKKIRNRINSTIKKLSELNYKIKEYENV